MKRYMRLKPVPLVMRPLSYLQHEPLVERMMTYEHGALAE
jgi:hypothetical protein